MSQKKKIFFICTSGAGASMTALHHFQSYLEGKGRGLEFSLQTASLDDVKSLRAIGEFDYAISVIPDKESIRKLVESGIIKSKKVTFVSPTRLFRRVRAQGGLPLARSSAFSKSVLALVEGKRLKAHRFI